MNSRSCLGVLRVNLSGIDRVLISEHPLTADGAYPFYQLFSVFLRSTFGSLHSSFSSASHTKSYHYMISLQYRFLRSVLRIQFIRSVRINLRMILFPVR